MVKLPLWIQDKATGKWELFPYHRLKILSDGRRGFENPFAYGKTPDSIEDVALHNFIHRHLDQFIGYYSSSNSPATKQPDWYLLRVDCPYYGPSYSL